MATATTSGAAGTAADTTTGRRLSSSSASSSGDIQCRICWASKDETPEALITPCACTGTMALVHRSCLITFEETRPLNERGKCGVCKTQFKSGTFPRPKFGAVDVQRRLGAIVGVMLLISTVFWLTSVFVRPRSFNRECNPDFWITSESGYSAHIATTLLGCASLVTGVVLSAMYPTPFAGHPRRYATTIQVSFYFFAFGASRHLSMRPRATFLFILLTVLACCVYIVYKVRRLNDVAARQVYLRLLLNFSLPLAWFVFDGVFGYANGRIIKGEYNRSVTVDCHGTPREVGIPVDFIGHILVSSGVAFELVFRVVATVNLVYMRVKGSWMREHQTRFWLILTHVMVFVILFARDLYAIPVMNMRNTPMTLGAPIAFYVTLAHTVPILVYLGHAAFNHRAMCHADLLHRPRAGQEDVEGNNDHMNGNNDGVPMDVIVHGGGDGDAGANNNGGRRGDRVEGTGGNAGDEPAVNTAVNNAGDNSSHRSIDAQSVDELDHNELVVDVLAESNAQRDTQASAAMTTLSATAIDYPALIRQSTESDASTGTGSSHGDTIGDAGNSSASKA